MAQNKNAPRHAEVYQRIAIDVFYVCTVGLLDEEGCSTNAAQGTYRTVDTAGDNAPCPLKGLL